MMLLRTLKFGTPDGDANLAKILRGVNAHGREEPAEPRWTSAWWCSSTVTQDNASLTS